MNVLSLHFNDSLQLWEQGLRWWVWFTVLGRIERPFLFLIEVFAHITF